MMYIFEAIYRNLETDETSTKRIDFTFAPTMSYREAFEYTLNDAFDMQEKDEELEVIRNISC